MMTKALCFLATFGLCALSVWATEPPTKADYFPERIKIADKELSLNGVGTRTATLFAIKVYHAAFYSDRSIASLPDALSAPNPKLLEIRYVRDFDLKQTQEAWRFQFHESSGIKDGDLKEEIDKLVTFQRPIKEGDVQRFDFQDGKTVFSIGADKQGEIAGAPFQKALLTIFFGPNPPTHDLQKGLTRGIKETSGG
jgi:hypothetical protein